MARSLNKVQLIGNLVRDPELRYTQTGTPICAFSIATDRTWMVNGEKKEESDFHRLIAWSKLAELCGKMLKKGMKIYAAGRLSNRQYEKDGEKRNITEIVLEDMIILSSRVGAAKADDEVAEVIKKPEATEEVAPEEIPA